MSTASRLALGTSLSISRLAFSIVGQILTVPIYLAFWDPETYGLWLIIQTLIGYMTIVSTQFQQFSYGEVLKCVSSDIEKISVIFRSCIRVCYMIALLEFCLVCLFIVLARTGIVDVGIPIENAPELLSIIIIVGVVNLIFQPYNGTAALIVTVYGHYPRTAAWGLFVTILSVFLPAASVMFGANLLGAMVVQTGAYAICLGLATLDMRRLSRRIGLVAQRDVNWALGLRYALFSFPLAGRTFVDSFRHQGFRFLLGLYAGPAAVTALATTRTFANVLHQGLSTITAPLMPELMRYVTNRDQDRMEGAFAIVWICLFVLLVPGVLILCVLAEPVFVFWTQGAVEFDPVLFLTLLVAVLVYATGQPASAILQGQNRIAWLISVSMAAAVGLAAFSVLLIPHFGLRGAGFAILSAEFCAATLTVLGAARALRQSGLKFPRRSFTLVATTVCVVFALSLLAVTLFEVGLVFVTLTIAANALFAALYWKTIPILARSRILAVLAAVWARLKVRFRADASGPK